MLVTRPWSCPACGSRVTLSENASDPRQCTACHWTAPDNPNPIPPPADAPAAPPEPFPEADIAAVRIWLRRHPVAALYVLFLAIITIGLWFGGRGAREHVALRERIITEVQQTVRDHLLWQNLTFSEPTVDLVDTMAGERHVVECYVTGHSEGRPYLRHVAAILRADGDRLRIEVVFVNNKFLYGSELSRRFHEAEEAAKATAP